MKTVILADRQARRLEPINEGQPGAMVRVVCGGRQIGVGLINYSSEDIARIKGLKRSEVAEALGDAHYPEVIHRDNLLIHAAV